MRRADFNAVVHIVNATDDERSWHFLKLGADTILLGNWYRPGSIMHDGVSTLYEEMSEYFEQVSDIMLVGTLNIHHQRWHQFSNANTSIGSDMKCFCDFHGLTQLVRESTRGDYLLDLIITDIASSSVKVLPVIADHHGL